MTTIKPFRAWLYVATYLSALLCPFGVCAQDLTVNFIGLFTHRTCTVDTPSIAMNMGQVSVNDITAVGVGNAIPASSSGTIELTCGDGANPQISFGDANNIPNVDGTYLILTPSAGVASGVGIQLFRDDGTPILLGRGHFVDQNVPAGPLSIPFAAHYYRTATVVTAGSANALGFFVFTYP